MSHPYPKWLEKYHFKKGHKLRVGKHHSEETKRKIAVANINPSKETRLKMSLARKGKPTGIIPKTAFKKGNNYGKLNKGRKTSEETKVKMSKAHSGNKHYNWKGGKTKLYHRLRNSNRWKTWRRIVFKRDNYTCHKCNVKEEYLESHHIVPVKECLQLDYEDLIFDVDNGETMCYDCHKNKHFGRH